MPALTEVKVPLGGLAWPEALLPQQARVPSVLTPQAWKAPAEIELAITPSDASPLLLLAAEVSIIARKTAMTPSAAATRLIHSIRRSHYSHFGNTAAPSAMDRPSAEGEGFEPSIRPIDV